MATDTGIRDQLMRIFLAAVAAVDGRTRVREALCNLPGAWRVAAVGKAAPAMALGAQEALGARLADGLVIGARGFDRRVFSRPPWRTIEAGHPLPDEASLSAGVELGRFIEAVPGDAGLLLLISGGASSLVELLPPGMTLGSLVALNRWLLSSGLDIVSVNRVRQAVSCLKGGRLAARLAGRRCRALLISDVPGDDPAVIGSGLVCAPAVTLGLPDIPPALLEQIRFAPAPPPVPPVELEVVAGPGRAMDAAGRAAAQTGLDVIAHPERFEGDAARAGARMAQTLLAGAAGIHLWGGETTVRLPPAPGRGGRCQHLALAAALALDGDRRCTLLAAGTDGRDGPGEDAGAIVDGGTLSRGRRAGLDPRDCLARADAGAFLAAAGDLLNTGGTGTNVADIAVGYRSD